MKIKIAYEKVAKSLWWLATISHFTMLVSLALVILTFIFDNSIQASLGAASLQRLESTLAYVFFASIVTMFFSNCLYANMFKNKPWYTVANIGIFYTTVLIMLFCAAHWNILPTGFLDDNFAPVVLVVFLGAYYASSIAVVGVANVRHHLVKLASTITIITMIINFVLLVAGVGILSRFSQLNDTQALWLFIGFSISATLFVGDVVGFVFFRWQTRYSIPTSSDFSDKEITVLRRRMRRCIMIPTIAIIVVNLIGLGQHLSSQKNSQSVATPNYNLVEVKN